MIVLFSAEDHLSTQSTLDMRLAANSTGTVWCLPRGPVRHRDGEVDQCSMDQLLSGVTQTSRFLFFLSFFLFFLSFFHPVFLFFPVFPSIPPVYMSSLLFISVSLSLLLSLLSSLPLPGSPPSKLHYAAASARWCGWTEASHPTSVPISGSRSCRSA